MENKRIFVYDTGDEFSEFITEQYFNHFSIDVCTNMKSIDDYNYASYDIFFIIAAEPKDVSILFKTVNNEKSVLFLGSEKKEIGEKFKENKRIINLDLFEKRSEIKKFIDTNINY
jgi:hypothetical protein